MSNFNLEETISVVSECIEKAARQMSDTQIENAFYGASDDTAEYLKKAA